MAVDETGRILIATGAIPIETTEVGSMAGDIASIFGILGDFYVQSGDPSLAGIPAMATFDDVTPAAASEDTADFLRMSERRELYVQIRDAAGNERGLNVAADGSIAVTGTVGVSGVVDTELPPAAALADNTANPTAPAVGAFGMVWDGATWDRMPGTSVDGALVNLGTNNDIAVTSIVSGTAATNLGKAEDAAHTSNDVGVMALAVRKDASAGAFATTLAASGDYIPLIVDENGLLWITGAVPYGFTSTTTESGVILFAKDASDAYGPILRSGNNSLIVEGNDDANTSFEPRSFGSDTFTATGNGTTRDVSTANKKYFALMVTQTGTVTSWDVRLEGTIDGGTTYTTILTHTNVTGSGVMVWAADAIPRPVRQWRLRCAGLVLGVGTSITVRGIAMV